jgi:hypothetical protein
VCSISQAADVWRCCAISTWSRSFFGSNYFKVAARGIQLDARTRTGWAYAPLNSEVQEFSY